MNGLWDHTGRKVKSHTEEDEVTLGRETKKLVLTRGYFLTCKAKLSCWPLGTQPHTSWKPTLASTSTSVM